MLPALANPPDSVFSPMGHPCGDFHERAVSKGTAYPLFCFTPAFLRHDCIMSHPVVMDFSNKGGKTHGNPFIKGLFSCHEC